jgi:hypothetical protein
MINIYAIRPGAATYTFVMPAKAGIRNRLVLREQAAT